MTKPPMPEPRRLWEDEDAYDISQIHARDAQWEQIVREAVVKALDGMVTMEMLQLAVKTERERCEDALCDLMTLDSFGPTACEWNNGLEAGVTAIRVLPGPSDD